MWEKVLKDSQSDSSNLVCLYHRLLRNNRTLSIDKMNSKELNSIIIPSKEQYLEFTLNIILSTHFHTKSP